MRADTQNTWSVRTVAPAAAGLALALSLACDQGASTQAADATAATPGAPPASEQEKVLYAVGTSLGKSVAQFGLTEDELQWVSRGLTDRVLDREIAVDEQEYGPKVMAFVRERSGSATDGEVAASRAFLAEAAAAPGAVQSDSGLVMTEIAGGEGASPGATDTVKVHYHGTLRDGTVFDSSVERGEPAAFPLNRVIPCWTEALQKMKVGGKSRIVCPPEIAYGSRGSGSIPGGAALVFEVELLEITPAS